MVTSGAGRPVGRSTVQGSKENSSAFVAPGHNPPGQAAGPRSCNPLCCSLLSLQHPAAATRRQAGAGHRLCARPQARHRCGGQAALTLVAIGSCAAASCCCAGHSPLLHPASPTAWVFMLRSRYFCRRLCDHHGCGPQPPPQVSVECQAGPPNQPACRSALQLLGCSNCVFGAPPHHCIPPLQVHPSNGEEAAADRMRHW